MAALLRFGAALALALLLFPVGFAAHEMAHLAIYTAAGVPAVLEVTHWRLGTLPVAIAGVHAAPLGPGGAGATDGPVAFGLLVLNNGLGPSLAALLLLVLWAATDRRSRVARAALLANVGVLLFFSTVELAYPLLEAYAHVDADVLLLPEVNYGGSLAVALAVLGVHAWRWHTSPRLRVVRPGRDGGRTGEPPGRVGRLPVP